MWLMVTLGVVYQLLPTLSLPNPAIDSKFTAYNCTGKAIDITCPEAQPINITDAYFGLYSDPYCRTTCCSPVDIDCYQFVDDAEPNRGRLDEIKASCNNQTSCEIEILNAVTLPDCPSPKTSHFMIVHFHCLGDDTETTAQPSTITTQPTTTPAPPITTTPPDDSNVGLIVGAVLGSIFLIALILFVVAFLYLNRHKLRIPKNAQPIRKRPVGRPPGGPQKGKNPQRQQNGQNQFTNAMYQNGQDQVNFEAEPNQAMTTFSSASKPAKTTNLNRKTSAVREYDVPFFHKKPVYQNVDAPVPNGLATTPGASSSPNKKDSSGNEYEKLNKIDSSGNEYEDVKVKPRMSKKPPPPPKPAPPKPKTAPKPKRDSENSTCSSENSTQASENSIRDSESNSLNDLTTANS